MRGRERTFLRVIVVAAVATAAAVSAYSSIKQATRPLKDKQKPRDKKSRSRKANSRLLTIVSRSRPTLNNYRKDERGVRSMTSQRLRLTPTLSLSSALRIGRTRFRRSLLNRVPR